MAEAGLVSTHVCWIAYAGIRGHQPCCIHPQRAPAGCGSSRNAPAVLAACFAPSTGPVRSSLAPSLMCLHCLQTDKDVKSRMESLLADITLLRGLFFEALRQSNAFKVTTPSSSVSTPSRALCSRDGPRARQSCVAAPCALEVSRSRTRSSVWSACTASAAKRGGNCLWRSGEGPAL
jgi:hypothetical protein